MICPAETPEGQSVGLVKNMALMCRVSVGTNAQGVIRILWDMGMEALDELPAEVLKSKVRVFVNGNWNGCFPLHMDVVSTLKMLRRKGSIPAETFIVYDIVGKVKK